MRIGLFCLLILSVVGCAKPDKPPTPPEPCRSGFNFEGCTVEAQGHSLWKWQPSAKLVPKFEEEGQAPLKPGEPDPRDFNVYYEFRHKKEAATDQAETQFRRFLILKQRTRTISMVETGRLLSVDDKSFRFVILSDSCGLNEQTPEQIRYYLRESDDHIRFGRSEIQPQHVSDGSPGGIIGHILAQAIVLPFEVTFEVMSQSLQSLAGMQNFLNNALGSFTAVRQPLPETGELGCFGPLNSFKSANEKLEAW